MKVRHILLALTRYWISVNPIQ